MTELASTGKVRRNHTAAVPTVRSWRVDPHQLRDSRIVPAVPVPVEPPRPWGDLTRAPQRQILAAVSQAWESGRRRAQERRRHVRALLGWLTGFPGESWQQRWDACGYADGGLPAAGPTGDDANAHIALRLLIGVRVLRPTLPGLDCLDRASLAESFRAAQRDPQLDGYFNAVREALLSEAAKATARLDVTRALIVFGIRFAELTPSALLQYSWECTNHGVVMRVRGNQSSFAAKAAWAVLVDMGHFPPGTPPTIRGAGQRGPLTVTELVDRYPIANCDVRQLLIDYLTRRSLELDYTSLTNLARWVAGLFWSRIETLAPGIADLNIPSHVYDQWRESINLRDDGKPRLSIDPILLSARSMYLDLHTWSVSEPERWGRWVAPCPIRPGEFTESGKRERRRKERIHQRIRERAPLLPILLAHVEGRLAHARKLLAAATSTAIDTHVVVDGHSYTRVFTDYDRGHHVAGLVRVRDESTGEIINAASHEDHVFWDWALVEVLRLTGCRIEEVLELTQLSIRKYVRPNGETIGLLVIAPSKTDRERVIPMSAELFAVMAAIIRRHHDELGAIPSLPRYDYNEKVFTAPMPFLFQRRHGPTRQVFNDRLVHERLTKRCADLATTHPAFGQAKFTPHDFRRLFATDVVNNGLPIHIGAALLGHLNLETTRGYVAVFEEDLIRHYQTFLERRRQLRPHEEYRPTTDQEWQEFQEHFDKRKVELGNCGRPYGTGCQHEHSCIRCPMLHVAPDALPRLDVIEVDLQDRRKRAEDENWQGEIEGIDLTLAHLQRKRAQAIRLTTGPIIPIGAPPG